MSLALNYRCLYPIHWSQMLSWEWRCRWSSADRRCSNYIWMSSGLDIKHLVYMPIGHMVLKIDEPCKNFHMPSQYLYKPCKAYVYCWENKYMPWLKNHLPSRACKHKSLCALGQDLHAPGIRARLNVEPWSLLPIKVSLILEVWHYSQTPMIQWNLLGWGEHHGEPHVDYLILTHWLLGHASIISNE